MFCWFRLKVFICCIYASVLLLGPAALSSNISTHDRLPNVVQDQEDSDLDSPFLQLRASLPAHLQPIRPYTLLTNAKDYDYLPKPRHHRPSRLLRILGSSFDPFWMSVDQPPKGSGVWGSEKSDSQPASQAEDSVVGEKFGSGDGLELRKAAADQLQKLKTEVAGLDLGALPSDVASSVRTWLVKSATCVLRFRWVDLGPAFWPRWLRQTDCEESDKAQSCSFPSGMECIRAQTTHINILAWHCLNTKENEESSGFQTYKSDGSTTVRTSEALKTCLWRQVPYPVVTACTCACK